jgi:hypothetical protein
MSSIRPMMLEILPELDVMRYMAPFALNMTLPLSVAA